MKRKTSQIFFAFVCAILGFLLAYQFKVIMNKNKVNTGTDMDKNQIISEIESLKKEKTEISKNNAELQARIKEIEDAATKGGEVEKEIKKQLDNARMQLGLVDVVGPGIEIVLTPKKSIFGDNPQDNTRDITESEIVHIVNTLQYSRAEAISVNGYRVTSQTGIKNSSNYIWIGSAGKVNPKEPIVIKAIGDKGRLNVAANFAGALEYQALMNYDKEIKQVDDLVINKTTQTIRSDYINPVKE